MSGTLGWSVVVVPSWPVLAWVATIDRRQSSQVLVYCGTAVEAGPSYVVEGVWPRPFEELGFDESSLFYGTGAIERDGAVVFVGSCSTVDRLWLHRSGETVRVSNSLPALLAVAEDSLVSANAEYARRVGTIVRGHAYQKEYPVNVGALSVHYFENITVDGSRLRIHPKRTLGQSFDDFASYKEFLYSVAKGIGANATSAVRQNRVEVVSTVSRGYDSPVATLMAREAGATTAYTLTSARSLKRRSDSGATICRQLEIQCMPYERDTSLLRDELYYWAANGAMQDMNLSLFEYPRPPSVLFTGFNGDQVWARSANTPADWLMRKDSSGVGFCEHRLAAGVIHCPVPYWGIENLNSLRRLSVSAEMSPWSIGGGYDRPIPRRLMEEVGTDRASFGQTKGATTVDDVLLWPLSNELASSYRSYLRKNCLPLPTWQASSGGRRIVELWRGVARERLKALLDRWAVMRASNYSWENYLFPWAVEEQMVARKLELRAALRDGSLVERSRIEIVESHNRGRVNAHS